MGSCSTFHGPEPASSIGHVSKGWEKIQALRDLQESRASEAALLVAVIGIEVRDLGRGHQHQVHFPAGGERLFAERREAESTEQIGDARLRGRGYRRSLRQSNGMASLRRLPNSRRPRAAIDDTVDLGDVTVKVSA